MSEVWKNLSFLGYPDYQVSSFGRVKGPRKILKPSVHRTGYRVVGLHAKGRRQTFMVHRLVALAFIPNPKGLSQVNHIDGDKDNNHRDNLEWCTMPDNMAHAAKRKLMPSRESNGNSKLTSKEVEAIRMAYSGGMTQEAIAKKFGIGQPTVSSIVRNKIWKMEVE